MSKARDLIKSALRQIGVIASGEDPSETEFEDALEILNDILEEWSNDGFMIFDKKIEEFNFEAGKGLYTIAPGADFDTKRPINVLGAKLNIGQGQEISLHVWNYQEWAKVNNRLVDSPIPQGIYYNSNNPYGEINVWPVPNDSNIKLILYSLKPFCNVEDLDDELIFPPGYRKALKLALSCESGPEFGKMPNAKLEDMAMKAKAAIQRTNTDEILMESDAFGLTEKYNATFWRIYG